MGHGKQYPQTSLARPGYNPNWTLVKYEVGRWEGLAREGFMSDDRPASRHAGSRRVGRWIAAALAVAILAACQSGGLTYDPSSGRFSLPFGAESHRSGGD
jgi:hypothetical protein